MRALLGILGLLLVLVIVGLLLKKQLAPVQVAPAAGMAPQNSQQVQQQVRESLEKTLQQPRPMPDEK